MDFFLRCRVHKSLARTYAPLSLMLLASWGCGAQHGNGPAGAEVLFVPDNAEILSYTINTSTGALQSFGIVPFPNPVADMKADSRARFLYVSDSTHGFLYGFSIEANTGVLTAINGSPFSTPGGIGVNGGQMAIDPGAKFLFYANPAGQISTFLINQTNGALTLASGTAPQDSNAPDQMAVDPSGRFLYASNFGDGSGNDFSAFSIDSTTGALTPIAGSPFTFSPNTEPIAVAINNSGTRLYAPLLAGRAVAGLNINTSTGALTAIAGSPFPNSSQLRTLALHPSGKFLYAGVLLSGIIRGYTVDQTSGALTQFSNPGYPEPAPFALAIDPSGQFLFNFGEAGSGGEIQPYAIDASTGALTPESAFPLPSSAVYNALLILQLP